MQAPRLITTCSATIAAAPTMQPALRKLPAPIVDELATIAVGSISAAAKRNPAGSASPCATKRGGGVKIGHAHGVRFSAAGIALTSPSLARSPRYVGPDRFRTPATTDPPSPFEVSSS